MFLYLSQLSMPREVQRGPDFGLAHLFEKFAVKADLCLVARGFLGEEAFQIAAFMVAGLVVDDPPGAGLVDKGAVDERVDQLAGDAARQRELARGIPILSAENPAPGVAVQRAFERLRDRRRFGVERFGSGAQRAQQVWNACDQPTPLVGGQGCRGLPSKLQGNGGGISRSSEPETGHRPHRPHPRQKIFQPFRAEPATLQFRW